MGCAQSKMGGQKPLKKTCKNGGKFERRVESDFGIPITPPIFARLP
jgi:hypothetical protein